MNVFSRTSKGNIIYTRQNKNLLFMVTFGTNSILSLVYFLDFLKDFYKKSLPTSRPLNILKILKR